MGLSFAPLPYEKSPLSVPFVPTGLRKCFFFFSTTPRTKTVVFFTGFARDEQFKTREPSDLPMSRFNAPGGEFSIFSSGRVPRTFVRRSAGPFHRSTHPPPLNDTHRNVSRFIRSFSQTNGIFDYNLLTLAMIIIGTRS